MRNRGFTLLEVLIALAVVGIVVTYTSLAIDNHLKTLSQLEDKTFAQFLAMNKMTELLAAPQWPPLGRRDEVISAVNREWVVIMEVKNSLLPKIRQIEVSVSAKTDDLIEEPFKIHTIRSLRSQHYLPDRNQS